MCRKAHGMCASVRNGALSCTYVFLNVFLEKCVSIRKAGARAVIRGSQTPFIT